MSPSRMLRMLARTAAFAAAAAGTWLGYQYLVADGLSPVDAAIVGFAAFVLATVVAFSKA